MERDVGEVSEVVLDHEMNDLMPLRIRILSLLLALSVASCGTGAGKPLPDSEDAFEQPTQPISRSSPAARNPTPTKDLSGPLSSDGPWLIIFQGEEIFANGLWAVNPDGTGLIQLVDDLIAVPRDVQAAISPAGGRIAFITTADFQLRGLQLKIIILPEGAIEVVTDLTSSETEKVEDADPALRGPEPAIAIVEEASLAWSPDGSKLAFMAAFEGPSSDLYVYSVEDGTITRLTDGPSQGIRPSWSPDGHYILHFGVETLGSGAGYEMAGAWAAAADNSGVINLYDPSAGDGEQVIGWIDDNTFAVYTFSQMQGGIANLRTVDVETEEIQMLWQGVFRAASLDPESGTIILASGQQTDLPQGLYHFDARTGNSWRIVEDQVSSIAWSSETGLFFAISEFGVLAITPSGDFIDLATPGDSTGFPIPSEGTLDLAWIRSGLWLGSVQSNIDNPPRQIFNQPVSWAAFAPGAQSLIFYSEDRLYTTRQPGFDPILIDTVPLAKRHAWVPP